MDESENSLSVEELEDRLFSVAVKQLDSVSDYFIGEAVYIFDGTNSIDFKLMYSEFCRYEEAINKAIENDSDFEFSSDYLNNIGKINCAGAWFNLSNAGKLLNEDKPKSMAAMVLLTKAGTLVTCAVQYYMTVIEPRRKGGKNSKKETDYPIIEAFYLNNTNGNGLNLKKDRVSEIATYIERDTETIVSSTHGEIVKILRKIKKSYL